jgi:hypothetical protein
MKKILIAVSFISICFSYQPANAQTVICSKNSNGAVTLRSKRCSRGETRIRNISQLKGETGAAGANGANGTNGTNGTNGVDGGIKVWGDGSAGALTLSTGFSGDNTQFTDVTIEAGSFISSGTTIRATGTCTINGALIIDSSGFGGRYETISSSTLSPATRISSTGVAFTNPGFGEFGGSTNTLQSGRPGVGLVQSELNALTKVLSGHSSGGAGGPAYQASGGTAGGAVAFYCRLGIIINASGSITANGGGSNGFGGGGGAGGLIVLASLGSIVNNGTISANGGNGGASSATIGTGGGGGGGLIRMLAPVITSGTTSVAGGFAGSNATAVTANPRIGGSGGGGFAADGGAGGSVLNDNTASAASGGAAGLVITTIVDPTSLLL